MNAILAGYAAAATPDLIARYDAFDPHELYAPVIDLFPLKPGRVADIGAGTGRDAAWFARQGHTVLAVEPVRELREPGRARYGTDGITWLDDTLPALSKMLSHGPFDLVTLNGVWQHINDEERRIAMPILARLLAPGGLLVLSLRHGPGAPGRPAFPVSPDQTIDMAERCGLVLRRRREIDSIQPANRAMGVRWTWLGLERPSSSP
jgi:SAM-dependent methyltransferase